MLHPVPISSKRLAQGTTQWASSIQPFQCATPTVCLFVNAGKRQFGCLLFYRSTLTREFLTKRSVGRRQAGAGPVVAEFYPGTRSNHNFAKHCNILVPALANIALVLRFPSFSRLLATVRCILCKLAAFSNERSANWPFGQWNMLMTSNVHQLSNHVNKRPKQGRLHA